MDKDITLNGLEVLLDQIPGYVYWLDRSHRFLGCNARQAKMLGFESRHEVRGRLLTELLDPEDSARLMAINARVISSGVSQTIEERVIRDDEVRVFISSKSPFYNEQGHVIGLIGISQDITEMTETISELHHQKDDLEKGRQQDLELVRKLYGMITGQKVSPTTSIADYIKQIRYYYEQLLNLIPAHIYWVDAEGLVLGCNDYQAQSFGYASRHDIIGKTCYDLMSHKVATKVLENNAKVIASRTVLAAEETVELVEGKKSTFYSRKAPLLDYKDNPVGVIGVSLDVSSRKQTEEMLLLAKEQAEHANRVKTEFLMNMSHDIRTPASGILGFAKILYLEESDAEKKQKLDYLVQSSERLLTLLNEIIDFSSNDAIGMPILHTRFNLKALVRELFALVGAGVRRKNIKLIFDFQPGLGHYFVGDRTRVHRILLNLLTNAIKFTDKGQIKVCIYKNPAIKSNRVFIDIEDTGVGIAEENLECIFDKFKRLGVGSREGVHSNGLGLSIVKYLVDELGGGVSVASESGKGSVFTVQIPLAEETSSMRQEKDRQVDYYAKPLIPSPVLCLTEKKPTRALVVEDDKISQKVTEVLLQLFNCQVDVISQGLPALNMDLRQYDFIILDIGLPDTDGFSLAKAIRNQEQEEKSKKSLLPIIGLTAQISPGYQRRARAAGMNWLLDKPLTKERLERL